MTRAYLLALVVITGPLEGQVSPEPALQLLYQNAVAASERGDLGTAIATMDSLLARDSTALNAWWNVGIWHAAAKQYPEALRAWQSYHALDSTDWRVEAKLVQAYQALGDTARRDSALAGILEHRRKTKNPELKKAETFCREQTMVDGHSLMVFEAFSPRGDRMVFTTFYLLGADARDTARFSLGSYDLTTKAARASKDIGPKDRLYHLDYYTPGTHTTFAFFRERLTYDDLRTVVWAAIRGEVRPVSGSRVSPQ